jgi:hypothetical protein
MCGINLKLGNLKLKKPFKRRWWPFSGNNHSELGNELLNPTNEKEGVG